MAHPRCFAWRAPRYAWTVVSLSAIAVLAACSGDSPVSMHEDDTTLPWIMHNDAGAVTVAVGGTQQIHATTFTLAGVPAANVPAATFTSSDPSTVTVTPTGLITGVAVTQTPTLISSSVFIDGVTFADTTQVVVTAVAHPLKSFSIHPAPGDSAKFGVGGYATLNLVAIDLTNTQQNDLAVKYTSSDPAVGLFSYGFLYGQARGTTSIVATATAYGTVWADTVLYTVTNPMSAAFICYAQTQIAYGGAPFTPNMAIVGVGGTVSWYNYSETALTLTFDDSTAVPGGVLNLSSDDGSSQSYTFTKAGIFTFKDQLGDVGTVAVVSN